MRFVNEACVLHNIINYNILYFRRVKIEFCSIYSQHVLYYVMYYILILVNMSAEYPKVGLYHLEEFTHMVKKYIMY